MEIILRGYSVNEATWIYLSFLLVVAIYFRFHRVWSLRNLDLLILLSLSPGIYFIEFAGQQLLGFIWLLTVTMACLVRCFLDFGIKRRPRLEQNLNFPGLAFLGIATFGFLVTRAVQEPLPESTKAAVREADELLKGGQKSAKVKSKPANKAGEEVAPTGPATGILTAPVVSTSRNLMSDKQKKQTTDGFSYGEVIAVKIFVVLSHFAIVAGLFCIGWWHFADRSIGLSMATLYLLLPCTAFYVSELNHALPAAFLLWALISFRHPMTAGILFGMACGTMFFPLFLLPVWIAFFGRKNSIRFGVSVASVAILIVGVLAFTTSDANALTQQTIGGLNLQLFTFEGPGAATGFWMTLHPAYRIPVMTAFVAMVVVLTIWPRKKTPEVLMAHSAAIIVSTQFWYPQSGGIYVLWYLPFLLLLVFRPRVTTHALQKEGEAKVSANRETTESTMSGIQRTGSSTTTRTVFR